MHKLYSTAEFEQAYTYHGTDLGVVDNAAVYDDGAKLARDRVNNVDDSFSVDVVPVFTLQIQGHKTTLSDNEVCDGILGTSKDSIAEAVGLYVDGKFIAAMQSQEELQTVLNGLKEGRYDKNDPDQRAEFVQQVVTEEGLYPISAICDATTLHGMLTSQTVKEETYTVQPGDVLGTIAVKHDMTTAELRALNPSVTATDAIQIGDTLVVQRAQTFLRP